ncbi:hypothetical protein E5Y90_16235 (plasmid) [Acinetobacter sp. 10FS3-1]|nr:hypothetical protein E5Y90_16235 [Acinetobacter sp. 10FS3-1]
MKWALIAKLIVFLTKFTGKMLQTRLKTHQLITKADFRIFCDQSENFKFLIFILIYKCYVIFV